MGTAEPCWFAPAELVVYGRELGKYLVHDIPMHVGQPHVASAEAKRAPGVVDAKQV